jgi:glyoxylase-like metal-dependent hydrolase (beta-lactamase superfamily II)
MLTRRHFCRSVAATAALGLTARMPGQTVRPTRFEVTALQNGAWAIAGGGGNALLVATADGPVLVDAKLAAYGAEFLDKVTRLAGRPPALVINTHHHGDHIGGNYVFSGDAEVIANARLRPRVAATLDGRIKPGIDRLVRQLRNDGDIEGADALADRTDGLAVEAFIADRDIEDALELEFGGVEMRLFCTEPAHTDNDLAVLFPRQNILHTGDLLFHRLHPFVDRDAGASTRGWQRAILAAGMHCGERSIVVPGHGDVTNKSGLLKQHFYFMEVREVVRTAMANGATRDEVIAIEPVGTLKDYGFRQMFVSTLGVLYDELKDEAASS